MQYQNDLWIYEQVLREKMQRQYPLSEADRQELQSLCEVLKLQVDDVQTIENRVSSGFTPLPNPSQEPPQLPEFPALSMSTGDQTMSADSQDGLGYPPEVAVQPPVSSVNADFSQTMPPHTPDAPQTAMPSGDVAQPVYSESHAVGSAPAMAATAASTDGVEQLLRVLIQKMETKEVTGLTPTEISDGTSGAPSKAEVDKPTELETKAEDQHNSANARALLPLLLGLACLGAIGAGIWFGLPKGASLSPTAKGNATDQNGVNWQQYLQWGLEKNKQGQYQAAIEDFSRAIQLNPSDTASYINRGVARHQTGDLNGALGDYDQTIRIEPKIAEAHSNRSHVLYDLKRYNEAQQSANTAVSLNPNLAEAQLNLANALFALNPRNPATAIEHYNQGIRLNPKRENQAGAYNNRANARAVDDPRAAIADYDQAIQLNPAYADAYRNRGIAFQRLGNDRLAVRDLQDASALYLKQGDQAMYQTTLDEISKIQQRTPQSSPTPQPQVTGNTVQFR